MTPQTRWMFAAIFAVVLAWALYLAIGAYLFNRYLRRGLIVLVSFALFLGFWALMLWTRGRRMREEEDDEPDDGP